MRPEEADALARYCAAIEELLAAWEALPAAVRNTLPRPGVFLPTEEA